MHDDKPRVMMESIKNVAVSDLVPSFLLLNLSSVTKFSCMFEKFSCARRMYHFTSYQVGDFSVPSGNFRVCNIHTISPATTCGAFQFLQEIVCDIRTISSATKWGNFWFLQEIFVSAMTYVPFHQLPSGGLSGLFRKFLCTQHTYYALPTILGLAQARPNYYINQMKYVLP